MLGQCMRTGAWRMAYPAHGWAVRRERCCMLQRSAWRSYAAGLPACMSVCCSSAHSVREGSSGAHSVCAAAASRHAIVIVSFARVPERDDCAAPRCAFPAMAPCPPPPWSACLSEFSRNALPPHPSFYLSSAAVYNPFVHKRWRPAVIAGALLRDPRPLAALWWWPHDDDAQCMRHSS